MLIGSLAALVSSDFIWFHLVSSGFIDPVAISSSLLPSTDSVDNSVFARLGCLPLPWCASLRGDFTQH